MNCLCNLFNDNWVLPVVICLLLITCACNNG